MRRLPLIASTALALAVAAPAGALTGWGVSGTLRSPGAPASASVKSTSKAQHTCQAGDQRKGAKSKLKLTGSAHNTAVVACEQPPRSDLVTSGLKSSAATALNTVG
jgi:hypothetical protein